MVNMVDEKLIIDRILSGDKEAFRSLIDGYQRLVGHIVFRMLPGSEEREDVCQEVFIKVYRNLSGFKFKSKLSTWIAKITRNTCINYLEKKRIPHYDDFILENETIEDFPGGENKPDEIAEQRNISTILQYELDKLPLRYRTVLTLYHLDEMNYAEIAEIMELPEGTVKSHLFRGRKYLRERVLAKYSKEELSR